jgi:hypothetical protein
MKRLLTLVLVALLSLGVASVSLAQEGGAAGGQAPAEQGAKTPTKHKKKHAKKHKKGKKKEAPADEMK